MGRVSFRFPMSFCGFDGLNVDQDLGHWNSRTGTYGYAGELKKYWN